ncbi:hypothetical protein TVAG_447900 [Trichomonas vaginalis G3]|uniref:Uncharacterized protein n=1 Tax=Trichomonas vaginalis (strain ATCC PRA-98 / G3) TaxID=412133 RepID=A2DS61_TRIV3|nr:armadillo (ARM) repeat-containing protein family [Trichomonas vaginalis G3]EAY16831.1 hypothetical protein TVAG_447900 [Trichomonas vaginalis G3]KAI5490757.1 armadillo (ARM) repeat-containing protein family [Trichomonas vaginalis G3]|eukprot:XP_001329054.1 hypothetical protein [Trichomonas vaginalis G3]
MEYKEPFNETKERKNLSDGEEEYDYDSSYEEDYFERNINSIIEYNEKGNLPLLAASLSAFSKILDSEEFELNDSNEEFFIFISSICCTNHYCNCITNALACTSSIISKSPEFCEKIISLQFLEHLLENIHQDPLVVSDNSLYLLLLSLSHHNFEYVSSIFSAECIFNFTLLPNFSFCQYLFIYIKIFIKPELIEISAPFLIQIFEKSIEGHNIELSHLPYALNFGNYLAEQNLLPDSSFAYISKLLCSTNSNTFKKACDLIGTLASSGIFYNGIDLELIKQSIDIYDTSIVRSIMVMLSFLLESEEFYKLFCESDFIVYIVEKCENSPFANKGPYIILFNSIISKIGSEISELDFRMFSESLEYISSEFEDDYTAFGLELVNILTEKVSDPQNNEFLFNQLNDCLGFDALERMSDSSNEDIRIHCQNLINRYSNSE